MTKFKLVKNDHGLRSRWIATVRQWFWDIQTPKHERAPQPQHAIWLSKMLAMTRANQEAYLADWSTTIERWLQTEAAAYFPAGQKSWYRMLRRLLLMNAVDGENLSVALTLAYNELKAEGVLVPRTDGIKFTKPYWSWAGKEALVDKGEHHE